MNAGTVSRSPRSLRRRRRACAAQDASKGEAVFKRCRACHAIGPAAQNKAGPRLDRHRGQARSATVPGFNYSDAMKEAGRQGPRVDRGQADSLPAVARHLPYPTTSWRFAGIKNPARPQRSRRLPETQSSSLRLTARAGGPPMTEGYARRPRVGLFVTCLVDLMRPSVGFAAVRLLEAAGCEVVVPRAPDVLRPARLQQRRPAERQRARLADDGGVRRLRLRRRAVGLVRGDAQAALSAADGRRCGCRRPRAGVRRARARAGLLPRRRARHVSGAGPLRRPRHLPRRLLGPARA